MSEPNADFPSDDDTPYTFEQRVAFFNSMYDLEKFSEAEMPGRLINFLKILRKEVDEGDDLLEKLQQGKISGVDAFTEMADWLGDVIVYCASEMLRYDIPVMSTLDIIMDSNESKLGEDGKPIHDPETGKVMKGPNYWKPESKIKAMLVLLSQQNGDQTP